MRVPTVVPDPDSNEWAHLLLLEWFVQIVLWHMSAFHLEAH